MGNPSSSCHVLRLKNSKNFVFQDILAVINFRIKQTEKLKKKKSYMHLLKPGTKSMTDGRGERDCCGLRKMGDTKKGKGRR